MKYDVLKEKTVALQVSCEADAVKAVLGERGRGFASPGEAYAELLARMDALEEQAKAAKKAMKELWSAVREKEEDSARILLDQMRRHFTNMGSENLWGAGLARVATMYPFGPFLVDEKLTATSPDDPVK